jgi:hypothetical protein
LIFIKKSKLKLTLKYLTRKGLDLQDKNYDKAIVALKELGFSKAKITRILSSKKDITDILLIEEIRTNLEMLETAIIAKDEIEKIEADYKKAINEAKKIRDKKISDAKKKEEDYKNLIKETNTSIVLIEGLIRGIQ